MDTVSYAETTMLQMFYEEIRHAKFYIQECKHLKSATYYN